MRLRFELSMFRNILENYFADITATSIVPIDVRVIAPDYYAYLCDFKDKRLAIVETDYLANMPGIAKDIEKAFGVTVTGWRVLRQHQAKTADDLLPPDSDDYDPDGTNEKNYLNYKYTVHEERGMRYAVMEVASL